MRVSLRWLNEFLNLPTSDIDELKRAFDYLGHAVESVRSYEAEWTGVVIGKVVHIEAHPDADNVRVTHVDLGDGQLHQIICGAWNFGEGAVVPVAVPGAVLPGGFEIGRRSIRGVESNGMICSESELGLGEGHAGIMVLDDDAPLGKPFESILEMPDVVFELEVTNNRPDVMGMVGVARELAAWFSIEFRMPDTTFATVPGQPSTTVTVTATDGCNRFVAREVRGIAVGPSPLWMRERLRRAGVRAISNVVDVTNYVMMEMGHPLHAFDADRIAGDLLNVRWAEPGETLTTLDDVERSLTTDDLVIADADGPTSLAAVMGGARSEVSADTTRVLMEAASWAPVTVMYTSRRHDLRSEASARFERGIDPNLAPDANARACKLLAAIGGGEILESVVDVVANPASPWTVDVPIHEVQRLLGPRFDAVTSSGLLRRLQLNVDVTGDLMTVSVPTYRQDLTRPADIAEEIARLSDFDTFPETLPRGPSGRLSAAQRRARRLNETMRGLGLVQAINLPFVSPEELAAFGDGGAAVVTVKNPLREDQSKLRQSLLPGLLRNLRDNRNRGAEAVAMFEVGRVFLAHPSSEDPRVPDQPTRLGMAVIGPTGSAELGRDPMVADGRTALAIVDALTASLEVTVERRGSTPHGFHPTRSADILLNGELIGHAGELHPDVADMYDLSGSVAIAEIDVDPILAFRPPSQMQEISTFPHVDFDLSFNMPPDQTAADVVGALRKGSELIETISIFDEYRDPYGLRSVAVSVRLRAQDRTLESAEIAAERATMIKAAAGLGAELRGGGDSTT